MVRLLENLILYLALTAFAIYGVLYLAPQIGKALSTHMEKAVKVQGGQVKL